MLNKEEVQHVAELARLDLEDEELVKISEKLSDVLEFIEQLREINTDNVKETSQVTGLTDVLRNDKIINWDKNEVDKALKEAPEMDNNELKVKKVL